MATPKRTFTGVTGQRSIGTAGAEQLSYDLDDTFAMFDPAATLRDGETPGGIGPDNLQSGAVSDTAIGDRTINQDIAAAFGNTGTLTQLLSWIVKTILALTGNAGNWYDAAAASLATLWGKFDATSGHKHTGAANDAPQIAYSSLTGVPSFQTVGDSVSEVSITGTGQVAVATVTPTIQGNFDVTCYLRVAETVIVTVVVDYYDSGGHQTTTLISQSMPAESWSLIPYGFNAIGSSPIYVYVTASIANQVRASASIVQR